MVGDAGDRECGRPSLASWKRVALLVGAVAVFAVARAAGVAGVVTVWSEPEPARALLSGLGVWGDVLYVASFVLLQPVGVPAVAFVLSASVVWPAPVAFVLSLIGGIGAGIVGFSCARFLARAWVQARLPQRFRRFDHVIAAHGLVAVFLVRLVFFLAPPSHCALGLSKVRFSTFVLGSAIGIMPGVAALTLAGGLAQEWLAGQRPVVWGVTLAVLATWLAARHLGRRKDLIRTH